MDLSGENSCDSVEIESLQMLSNMQPLIPTCTEMMTTTDPRAIFNGDFSMESEYVYVCSTGSHKREEKRQTLFGWEGGSDAYDVHSIHNIPFIGSTSQA